MTSATDPSSRPVALDDILRAARFAALILAIITSQLLLATLHVTAGPTAAGQTPSATNQTPAESVIAEIKAAGLKLASAGQLTNWLADPRDRSQQIIFVDARNQGEFLEGHLPGAWLFDPYQPEKYFPTVLPACQAAEQIIVYCHGGDCDDSVTAARLLEDAGTPAGKLWIYNGGMSEWETNGQPLEIGPQNSGQFKKGGT